MGLLCCLGWSQTTVLPPQPPKKLGPQARSTMPGFDFPFYTLFLTFIDLKNLYRFEPSYFYFYSKIKMKLIFMVLQNPIIRKCGCCVFADFPVTSSTPIIPWNTL
jgi:hypothetical protein